MKIGDFVHNVPYEKYGMIVGELTPITDPDGNVAERRLEVLYSDGEITLSGSTFLKNMEKQS
jgi:hypothetical protein